MSFNSFVLGTALPFIPDGNPPTESTSGANSTTVPAATSPAAAATTVSVPQEPEQTLVVVTLPEDTEAVSNTTSNVPVAPNDSATSDVTTATTEVIAVATDEQGAAVTSVNPEGETVVIATNSAGESVAATTNISGEVAVATTTALVQPDGTVSTGFESDAYTAETIEVVPAESTADSVTQNKSNTTFVLAFIAVLLVFLIAGALILIPKLKKSK